METPLFFTLFEMETMYVKVEVLVEVLANKHLQGLTVYLVEHGASVNVQNNDGITPLHLSILASQDEISKYLIEHRAWLHLSTLEVRADKFY